MIDKHLRYLMLYHTFAKIKAEAPASNQLHIDKASQTATQRLNVGNLLELEFSLKFFATND